MNAAQLIKVGPSGPINYKPLAFTDPWEEDDVYLNPVDHKGMSKISKIFVRYDSRAIVSLQFQYVQDGKIMVSEDPATTQPESINFCIVTLDYPDEYITSLSGTHDNYCIRALTFGTNKSSYGPFGNTSAASDVSSFAYQFGPGRNFHGFFMTYRAPNYHYGLDEIFRSIHRMGSIGAYLYPEMPSLPERQGPEEVKREEEAFTKHRRPMN